MAVIEATDENFSQELENHSKVIVKYYADWCGSCRLFNPKYKRLSGDDRFQGVTFLNVNAEKNEVARKVAGVTNLPFFAVFKSGVLVDAVASSKEEAVVELMNKLN
ncbi:thioredoxin family protein [Reichenbachiella sp. MALMAid0571]|uniref:thioredoxin family protein n=1 Tax=Reichenbachiella sp. MALMAid0571 TaxID=3143939 RepID=UPI0032E00CBA